MDTLQPKVLEKAGGDQSRLPGRGKTKYQEGQLSLQQEANKGRSSDLDQLDLPPKDRFALRDRKRIIKEEFRVQ